MPKLLFNLQDNTYCIYSIDNANCLKEINIKNRETLGNIYDTCFGGGISIDKIHDLNSFTEGRGTTIIITDKDDHTVFIASLIKNTNTGVIELFNICKDLHQKQLSGYKVLDIIINHFIRDNTLFKGYENIRLAMLCNNPYLIPAFKTYCRLGFRVESEVKPVLSMLSDYITMIRPVLPTPPSVFQDQLTTLFTQCSYDDNKQHAILEKINNYQESEIAKN